MRVLRLSVVTRIIGRNTCWNRERFETQNKLLPLPRARHDSEFRRLPDPPVRRGRGGACMGARLAASGKFGFRRGGPPLTLR
jgi:hypothetical protein